MRRQLSSTLLRGALYAAALIAITTTLPASLAAQQVPAGKAPTSSLEVAVTWNGTLSNAITSSRFWMEGGSVDVHGQFYRGLGVVADIAGAHTANINASSVGLDMVTATFGPRYTWSRAHQRYQFFAQGLVGIANGFNSVFPSSNGANTVPSGLAVKAGGGVNVALTPHIALRAAEVNWLRTQFPNSTTNVQNNITFGAGVVVRFR